MKKLLFGIFLLAIASPTVASDTIKFAYATTSKPFSWEENGSIQGILIDIADEIAKRLELKVSHRGYPWERSQHLVKIGMADALITNGPMRTKWASHSNEIVLMLQHKLYVKKDGPKYEQLKQTRSLDDLKPFKLVDHRGSAWAKRNLADRGIDVHWVADHDTMYRLVAKGRVDAVVYINYVARFHITNLGLQNQITELPLNTSAVPFHIVIGNGSPHVKLLPKIDAAISQMKEDGTLQGILVKYQ